MYSIEFRQRAVARFRFLRDRNPESTKTGLAQVVADEFGVSAQSVMLWDRNADRTPVEAVSRTTHSPEPPDPAEAQELPD